MRAPNAATAAPRDERGDPRKFEPLARRLEFKNVLAAALRQAENLAALMGGIDPALVAGLLFALMGGPRR
jgi:hypothetical protein